MGCVSCFDVSSAGLTARVSCGCTSHNLQVRETDRRSRQLDALLGKIQAPDRQNDERRL